MDTPQTYEAWLDKTDKNDEDRRMEILIHFRRKYGWVHHPYICCATHELGGDASSSLPAELPIMSATEYQYILGKSEREKEEYRKRIFLNY